MTIYHAQIGFSMNTALPKDVQTINPHYNATDPVGLANALRTNILANTTFVASTCAFTIKIYVATGAPPHYPVATATGGSGVANPNGPSEVSLALSYYAGFNQPRLRGRLYIPLAFVIGAGSLARIPSSTYQNSALGWGATLGKTLNAGSSLAVYSRKTGTAADVTNYYVDNEWDTVRSRGLTPSSRVLGTIP